MAASGLVCMIYVVEIGMDGCNNNNLWNVHIIIPCRRSFSVLVIISGISHYTNFACVFYSQSNFIGSYFLYSPRRQAFLIDFICVFIGCSLASSFRYSLVFKPFLVNFRFLDFFLIG